MRTTIDLPNELYRTLKTRAAISGVTMRQLIQGFIEQGLSQSPATTRTRPPEGSQLPIAIPARGIPVTLTAEDIHRLDEEDFLERHGRSS